MKLAVTILTLFYHLLLHQPARLFFKQAPQLPPWLGIVLNIDYMGMYGIGSNKMKWIFIILFSPLLANANPHYEDNTSLYGSVRSGTFIDTATFKSVHNGTKFFKYYIDGSLTAPILTSSWTNYNWDSTNGTIAINRTNYPSLHAGDSVKILPKFGGYYARLLTNCNAGAVPNPKIMQTYITVFWEPGAYITPQTSSIQANYLDSIYGVHEVGMHMSHHADVENFHFAATGYIQYYFIDKDTCVSCSGLWLQSLTLSLPAFQGGADSVNCFYMDSVSNSYFDSVGNPGPYDGLTTMYCGNLTTAKNQIWARLGITNNFFGDNPSTHNPATFIFLGGCIGVTIKNNVFKGLGGGTGTYVGHADCIGLKACFFDIEYNHFESNFGNCVRNLGNGGLPGWPGMNGYSIFSHNIDSFPVKYPFIETQKDLASDSQYVPGYIPRCAPIIANNIFAHPAMGVGHQYYNCSTVDEYSGGSLNDSLRCYNNIQYGPTDTLATVCTAQGCNAFMTFPNGAITYIDSSGNIWSQTLTFPGTGFADSIKFYPKINGLLYNRGTSNAFVLLGGGADIYGSLFPSIGRPSSGLNTGIDIGAVQALPGYLGPIPKGAKIRVF